MFDILTKREPTEQEMKAACACNKDYQRTLMLIERHQRAAEAHEPWATAAKQCVQFVEGKQWTDEERKLRELQKRPVLTINKIAPLVRLVEGYHRNNRTDIKYLPGDDGTGTEEASEAITHIVKTISERNQVPYIDAEVFLEGLMGGRGFFDHRISFDDNDLGEAVVSNPDPFSVFLDPDGDAYDLNKGNFVNVARWISIDEIDAVYGPAARALVEPLVHRSGYAGMPSSLIDLHDEITPWRTFGGEEEGNLASGYEIMESYLSNVVDPLRKNIRLVESQYWVRATNRYFLDLETGQRHMIPDFWKKDRIDKVLAFFEYKYSGMGRVSPIRAVARPGKRVRWTTMIGDFVVFDSWSMYPRFTVTGFFPYWRRGQTRGMVHDLIDPQREINKRRSSEIEIVGRTANGGWKYHETSLDPDQERALDLYGSMPGFKLKWKGNNEPKEINPSPPPTAMERLERSGVQDLREISNVNEYLQGISDRAESGRAITARQRQAVIGLQSYMDNFQRTKEFNGRLLLDLIQGFYTEERVIRTLGEDGAEIRTIINQRDAAGRVVNDVTLGRYSVAIDETPLSASFMSQQFDELMELVEKQILPVQAVMDVAIEVSTLPQKDTIKRRVQQVMAAQGIPMGDEAGMGVPPGAPPGAPPQPGAPQQLPAPPPGVVNG